MVGSLVEVCSHVEKIMSDRTKIEWADATWNPVTGCSPVSIGCDHCYARAMAERLKAAGSDAYRNGFEVTTHEQVLDVPLHWQKPRRVFVCSMGDLFHPQIPVEFIARVFGVMRRCPQHTFLVLTKRAVRMRAITAAGRISWGTNAWPGVTVETQAQAHRIVELSEIPAVVRFISAEPLLGDIQLRLREQGVNWVIAGGESGPGARPMDPQWVRNLRQDCVDQQVPFFFKQWGGSNKRDNGRVLDGRTWDESPKQPGDIDGRTGRNSDRNTARQDSQRAGADSRGV